MKLAGYEQFGAQQIESGALRNVLTYRDVVASHTGPPFTEALLFGIGGGIGLAYFTFDMHRQHLIYLGTRIHTKETARPEFLETLCARLEERGPPSSIRRARGQPPPVSSEPSPPAPR